MKNINCLFLLTSIPLLFQEISYAENPQVNYVELTDAAKHAGTRSSRSNLKIVKRDNITVNAVANVTKGSPTWEATVGSISGAGTSATWTGDADSNIKASFADPPSSASAGVTIVAKTVATAEWDSDPYKTRLDALQKAITAFAEKNGAENPVTLSGKLTYTNVDVDKYNNGEETGKSRPLKSNLKIAMAQIKAESSNIPTPWPFVFVKVGVDLAPISLDLTGDIKYSPQFSNPWVASSITANPKSSVKATVKVLLGAAAGENSAGIQAKGSLDASIQATINFKGEGNKIVTDGSYSMGSLVAGYEVSALISVLGAEAEWKFAEGEKEISKDGEEQKIERKVLVEW
jgi:hypothetical protein